MSLAHQLNSCINNTSKAPPNILSSADTITRITVIAHGVEHYVLLPTGLLEEGRATGPRVTSGRLRGHHHPTDLETYSTQVHATWLGHHWLGRPDLLTCYLLSQNYHDLRRRYSRHAVTGILRHRDAVAKSIFPAFPATIAFEVDRQF